MKNKLILYLLTIVVYSCDPAGNGIKVVNHYKDSILVNVSLKENLHKKNLEHFKANRNDIKEFPAFYRIDDTMSSHVVGGWENKFSHPNDTLFVFVTEKEKLRDYFKGEITKERTYEVFIITYNEILNYNWIIPIPLRDTIR